MIVRPDFSREARAMAAGARRVAGVDEAGRGPLAGPVAAAAVILDPKRLPDGLADSKMLTARRREALFETIMAGARVGIGLASAAEIDRLNIRMATFVAMRRALEALGTTPCLALVDGKDGPDLHCSMEMIVAGDSKVMSIAAASIVAKTVRDRLMARIAQLHPHYGFEEHKGYGTAAHRAALVVHGPCAEHRRSFAPVRAAARL